ncbi:MAG: Rid family hydrolase, partial [Gammaproteobacteria bacterium]|nr:Rid family hydrolase [Gammaproteobacteria bacterium]
MQFLNPSAWQPAKGYANGVLTSGQLIFVGGQIGWDGQQVFQTDDLIAQTKQVLQNIVTVLAEAGAGPE